MQQPVVHNSDPPADTAHLIRRQSLDPDAESVLRKPAYAVFCPEIIPQRSINSLQYPVSRLPAVIIVNFLHVIHVHQKKTALHMPACQCVLHHSLKGVSVCRARERIPFPRCEVFPGSFCLRPLLCRGTP